MKAESDGGSTLTDEGRQVNVAVRFGVGASGFDFGQQVSGPRDFVDEVAMPEPRSLLRWGVFVVTFVPIAVTLIAKAPEIITALAKAFGWGN